MNDSIAAANAQTQRIIPRRPWLAALLSLLFSGPIGQIYAGLLGQARFIYWSRDYTFPNPNDRSSAVRGPFRWDRIGMRLD